MALSDNLVAYWSLGNLVDEVAGLTLTNVNSATFVTGKVGNAVNLVNASAQQLTIADNATLSMGDIDFSWAFWLQLASGGNRTAFAKWSGTDEYACYYNADVADRLTWTVRNTANNANGLVHAENFGALSTATWYFVVVSHDSVGNQTSICINDTTPNTLSWSGGVRDSTSKFSIGALNDNLYFDGGVDELGLWKGRNLSSAEITELYNGGSGRDYAYISGAGGTTYDQAASGTLTSSGTLSRSVSKSLAGTLTSAGAIIKATAKSLAGTLTSSGAMAALRTAYAVLTGTLTSAGTLVLQTSKGLAGALTSAGSLVKQTSKSLAGTLTSSGAIIRSIAKALSGALTFAGDLAADFQAGAGTFFQSVGGTLTSSGALTRQTAKGVDGTLASAGTLTKQTAKLLAGALSPDGALSTFRTAVISLAGTLASAGALMRQTNKGASGTLTPTGAISKTIAKSIGGVLSFLGTLLAALVGAEILLLDVGLSDAAVYSVVLNHSAVYAITLSDRAVFNVTLSDTTRS